MVAGAAEIWMLAALAFVFGTGEAIFMPASSALIPETVSAARLQPANALLGMSRAATMIAGPAVGGVLVAGAGPGAALVVHAATYAVSAAFLLPMHTRSAPGGARSGFLRELRAGYREVRCRRWLWASIVGFAAFSVMAFPAYMVAGPVIAKDELGGPGAWAVILTAGSVGALVGSVVALRFRPRRPMLICWLLCLVEPPQLVLLGLAGPVPAIAFLAFLGGITFPMFETLWTTTIQRNVPSRRARARDELRLVRLPRDRPARVRPGRPAGGGGRRVRPAVRGGRGDRRDPAGGDRRAGGAPASASDRVVVG